MTARSTNWVHRIAITDPKTGLPTRDFLQSYNDLINAAADASAPVNVLDFIPGSKHGAIAAGTSTYDATADIQSAIDETDASATASPVFSVLTLEFPPGTYCVTDELSWKNVSLIGVGALGGVTIAWNGAAGGLMLRKTNATFARLENIRLASGSAEPASFIDFTAGDVDIFTILNNVYCYGCTDSALRVGSFVNLHWSNLRFDLIGGYAVYVTVSSTASLLSFFIDGFTYDHQRTTNKGKGFLFVDNAHSVNPGTFALRGARLEAVIAWDTPNSIIASSGGGEPLTFHLSDIDLNLPGSPTLYSHSGTNTPPNIILTNTQMVGLSAWTAGNITASYPAPPLGNYASLVIHGSYAAGLRLATDGTSLGLEMTKGGLQLPAYTVATLPNVSSYSGRMIYVTNETGGATPAWSNGTNWLRVYDGAIVS